MMSKKVWIFKGLSMMAATGAVISGGSHKIEIVALFAALAVLFSTIGDHYKKDKS